MAIIRREIAEQLEIERDGEHRRRIQNRDNLVNNVLKPFALVGGVILAVAGHAAAGVLAIGVALYQLAPALIEKFFARWLREQESGGPDDAPE
ncbi:MAG: hypothetical protein O3A46_00530 [Candidatus Poribacteria bacterium]|nr:hypothetical protein [Candidatus Poribacteria bacterium]